MRWDKGYNKKKTQFQVSTDQKEELLCVIVSDPDYVRPQTPTFHCANASHESDFSME